MQETGRRELSWFWPELAQNGVTSVQDFSAWEDFQAYGDLKRANKLTVRVTEWLPFTLSTDELQNRRAEAAANPFLVKNRCAQRFYGWRSRQSHRGVLAPYSDDPSTSGMLTVDPEKLKAMAIERDRLDLNRHFFLTLSGTKPIAWRWTPSNRC